VVIALAGRRIDAPDASSIRFPLSKVPEVRRRVRSLLEDVNARVLVSSGACGADLIAQEEAAELRIRGRLVLPFGPDKFRDTSVTDRPGNWGPLYDRVLQRAMRNGDLVLVSGELEGDASYAHANQVILDETSRLANAPEDLLAAIVWEGYSRGAGDFSEAFRNEAARRRFRIVEIPTI
jgi:hypothetical protein